jgi:hypothetical protein
MDTTRSTEQLVMDLQTILAALDSRTPTDGLDGTLWFEIGRAMGTANNAIIMSGGCRGER